MNNVKEYQYKDLAATSNTRVYNGTLYVVPTDNTKNIVTSPVNKLTGTNATTTTDTTVISNTLSGNSGQLKFNVSFKIHSDLFTQSANKYILDFEGLIRMRVCNGVLLMSFPCVSNNWYSINSSELVSGWNNITLSSDATDLNVQINSTTHNLFHTSPITKIWYGNFSNNTFIVLPKELRSTDNSVWHFGFKTSSNMSTKQAIIHSEGFLALEFNSTNLYAWSFSNGSQSLFSIAANTEYWMNITFNGSSRYVEMSADGGATYPYTKTFTDSTNYASKTQNPHLACSSYSEGSDYFRGEIEMLNFTITTSGVRTFDGSTAVAGTDYTIAGTPSITNNGVSFPQISVGNLTVYQTALYLKDIQAIKLED